MTADIPVQNDGTIPDVTMTTIADIGKYVAAACTLPLGTWPEESYIAGQTLNFADIISIVEKVRGKDLAVRKHTKTEMREQIDFLPAGSKEEEHFMARFFLQLSLAFADGIVKHSIMPAELNGKFPAIKPTQVEEYVTKYWSAAA
jgi:hypothetical protein